MCEVSEGYSQGWLVFKKSVSYYAYRILAKLKQDLECKPDKSYLQVGKVDPANVRYALACR